MRFVVETTLNAVRVNELAELVRDVVQCLPVRGGVVGVMAAEWDKEDGGAKSAAELRRALDGLDDTARSILERSQRIRETVHPGADLEALGIERRT